MSDQATPAQPPRATLISWLKINLTLTIFLCSLVSGGVGFIVHATLRYSDAGHEMDDQKSTIASQKAQIATLQTEMIDVDRRFNLNSSNIAELRRERDTEVAALAQRIAVVEAQLRFFAERTPLTPGARGR